MDGSNFKTTHMKLYITSIFIALFSWSASAQMAEGTITYNRKTNWISIMEKLPYVSSEEADRMRLTWGNNDDNKGQNYLLYLKEGKAVYTYKEEESESGWSWKKDDYVLIRDYKDNTLVENKEELGVLFLVEDKIPKRKWKILTEIKEVAGYLCMKAETQDTIKGQTIHAWFTDAIPSSAGPEGYDGLPGMILELDINDGDAVITATDVDLTTPVDKLPIPKKLKGKKVDMAEMNQKIEDFIAESIEGRRNPYWRIRY